MHTLAHPEGNLTRTIFPVIKMSFSKEMHLKWPTCHINLNQKVNKWIAEVYNYVMERYKYKVKVTCHWCWLEENVMKTKII